ncbi:uncharacterized protein HMPREF1120_03326 [Exophiala dermatitidis NIH/UT8656]|uniref:Uncharacterized protein n=1 Tax=Exophiala dermatitidis (strain ATCC 34100 / CBS 525.76 / NIH/UT8656) TaxID=858893 RepID=H6BW76_EXODN|nr:uncharacterized protein HMPREF1120_03326 [Exophiala dermatitidis NIH/UT8656]EHY55176.1 hypothetical protein HMPREF1120_03326 [Exophiala dermatitidis NIH/UT8656]
MAGFLGELPHFEAMTPNCGLLCPGHQLCGCSGCLRGSLREIGRLLWPQSSRVARCDKVPIKLALLCLTSDVLPLACRGTAYRGLPDSKVKSRAPQVCLSLEGTRMLFRRGLDDNNGL